MTPDFGGLGGIAGGRARNADDLFEGAVERVLGERIRADRSLAEKMWGALANVGWKHVNGDTANYSFRAAGDLVAAIYGQGTDYLDFYCAAPYGAVCEEVSDALAAEGWRWELL